MSGQGPGSQVFALRPLNITDLLDMVIRIYRRHFGELIAIAAVVYVPLGVLQALSMSSMVLDVDIEHPPQAMPFPPVLAFIGLGVWALLMWLSMPLMQAAMAKAVSEHYLGGRTSLREAYDFALGRWLALIVVAVALALLTIGLMGLGFLPAGVVAGVGISGGWNTPMTVAAALLAVVGMLLAMVGIAYVGTKLFFGALAVVLESAPWRPASAGSAPASAPPAFFLVRWWEAVVRAATHAGQGLRRSWELTEGHFWRVLGTMALLVLMVNVAAGIIVWPVQLVFALMGLGQTGPSVGVLHGVSALAQLLCQPLQIIGTVLLYYDLRIRKEGFDLTMMAEAIREPGRVPWAPSGDPAQAGPLYGPPRGAGFQPATRPVPPPPPPPADASDDQQGPLS